MTILDAGILGVVEGITEFLPVSSTGHLILATKLLSLPSTEFLKSFEISIQLGAILSIFVLYWRSFLSIPILKRLVVGFIPTGVIGLLLYHLVKTYLLDNELVVLITLFLGGVLLILFEQYHTENEAGATSVEAITYKHSFLIGLFQSVAIIPGVSRSAASILGGLTLGIRRATIVEFSFLLAVPTMLAATGLDLAKNASSFAAADFTALTVGFVVSFIVALVAVRYFLAYVRRYTFTPFGIYRILVSLAFLAFLFF